MYKITSSVKYILSSVFFLGLFFANQQVISKSYTDCDDEDCAVVDCVYDADEDTYYLTCDYFAQQEPCECYILPEKN
jgi:hypothetical protein